MHQHVLRALPLTHTPVCTHSQTLILPLPSSVMSLSKDLFPHISLWTFLRSRLLHPWNWRLEWILSPLINFIYHSLCLLLLLTVNLLIWKGSCWTDVLRSSHYSADPLTFDPWRKNIPSHFFLTNLIIPPQSLIASIYRGIVNGFLSVLN